MRAIWVARLLHVVGMLEANSSQFSVSPSVFESVFELQLQVVALSCLVIQRRARPSCHPYCRVGVAAPWRVLGAEPPPAVRVRVLRETESESGSESVGAEEGVDVMAGGPESKPSSDVRSDGLQATCDGTEHRVRSYATD